MEASALNPELHRAQDNRIQQREWWKSCPGKSSKKEKVLVLCSTLDKACSCGPETFFFFFFFKISSNFYFSKIENRVDLQYYISLRYKILWFNLFIDYTPVKVIIKKLAITSILGNYIQLDINESIFKRSSTMCFAT